MATTTTTKAPAPAAPKATYDMNTGKALAPGQAQSVFNSQTGQQIGTNNFSNGVASTNPVANQSTTTLSTQNKIDQVPTIQNTTTGLANNGVKTDATTGVATNADGSPYTPPTEPVKASTTTGGYIGDVYYAPGAEIPKGANLTQSSSTSDSILNSLNTLKSQNDANTAGMIGAIQAQYSSLIQQQQQTNKAQEGQVQNALLMGGATGQGSSAQFAPISSVGIVSSQINYGLQQVADLTSKEQLAIAQAQQAGFTNDYQLQDKINQQIQSIRKEKQDAVVKMQNDIVAAKQYADKQAQQTIENNLASDKFTYQQKADAIDQAFKQGQLNEEKRHNLATELVAKQAASAGSGLNGTMPGVQMTAQGTPNKTNQEAFLAALPPMVATQVKGIAEYDINPSSFSSSKRASQGGLTQGDLVALAKQYDPSYSESEYAARASYKKSLAGTGPSTIGGSINSANKAVNHLTAFVNDMNKTANTPSSMVNWTLNNTVGQVVPGLRTTLGAAKTEGLGVADELAKFFKGSGATDVQSIKDWQEKLSSNASNADVKGLTQGAITLLAGQLETLSEQYQRTMGKAPDNNFMGESAKKNLESLKNQGYQVDIPGINFTDKDAYLSHGGSVDALKQAHDMLINLNDPNNPPTPENILELAQISQ